MKIFTKIETVLTIIVVVEVAVMARMAAWLNAMHFSDPTRAQLLHSHIGPVVDIFWDITFFPWLLLTPIYLIFLFIHLGAWVFGKFTDGDKVEHQKPVH